MPISREQLLTSKSLSHFLGSKVMNESSFGEELNDFIHILEVCEFERGASIVTEGEAGDAMYFVEQGQASVIKESEDGKVISKLSAGDFFGELALISGEPRAATIRAEEHVIAFKLSKASFDHMIETYPKMNSAFLTIIYERLTLSYKQLEANNEALKKANQMRIELGTMFTNVILIISFYTFLMILLRTDWVVNLNLPFDIDYVFARIVELTLLVLIVNFIRKSSFTLKDFGLTFAGWRPAVIESIGITIIVIIGLYALKWSSITYGFDFIGDGRVLSMEYVNWSFAFYLPIAFLQELIARGVVQGAIQRLLVGRFAQFWAVSVAASIFALLHTHSANHVVIAAFTSGFLWGFMYIRHRNLIGITLSHFFIGNFAEALGFWA